MIYRFLQTLRQKTPRHCCFFTIFKAEQMFTLTSSLFEGMGFPARKDNPASTTG